MGCREQLGDMHMSTLSAVDNLALLMLSQGKPDTAEPLCREVLRGRRKRLGSKHPRTLSTIGHLQELRHIQVSCMHADLRLHIFRMRLHVHCMYVARMLHTRCMHVACLIHAYFT